MILAIDGYEANIQGRVGIGQFAYEILCGIAREVEAGRSIYDEVCVYLPHAPLADMPKESSKWKYRVVGPTFLWTFIGLPLALWFDITKPTVVFSPTHYIPRFVPYPRVMAIMDVSYLSYPELFRRWDLHKLVHWTAYSVRRAKRIITISEFSKNAIIKAYKVNPNVVRVAYPGLVQKHEGMGKTVNVSAKYNLGERYILSVGTLQPRKNFSTLIEAFSRIDHSDMSLVIVGKKGWLYEDILSAPDRFGVSDRVKFLDFVPDSDLPSLYEGAEVFVLPSLYEGFGLPVLEAMSYGVPVVVSDVSSLPEIAGDGAIYVHPEQVESIEQGLTKALHEKGTANEKKRLAAATKQLKKFSWEKAAKEVLDVLEDFGKGKRV